MVSTYADFKEIQKQKQCLKGLNLSPRKGMCYTYSTLGRRLE